MTNPRPWQRPRRCAEVLSACMFATGSRSADIDPPEEGGVLVPAVNGTAQHPRQEYPYVTVCIRPAWSLGPAARATFLSTSRTSGNGLPTPRLRRGPRPAVLHRDGPPLQAIGSRGQILSRCWIPLKRGQSPAPCPHRCLVLSGTPVSSPRTRKLALFGFVPIDPKGCYKSLNRYVKERYTRCRILRIGFVWRSIHTVDAYLESRISPLSPQSQISNPQSRPPRPPGCSQKWQIGVVWRIGGRDRPPPATAIASSQIISNR
jgi:hypothetical protein